MKKTASIISILATSTAISHAQVVVFSIDAAAGTISDTATSTVFATFTTSNASGASSTGIDFRTSTTGNGAADATFNITINDSDYTLTSVLWASRASTTDLGGGANTTLAGFRLNQAGTLTTGAGGTGQTWTLAGSSITNGDDVTYTAGDVFTHSRGGNGDTADDHWNLASTTNLSQTLTVQRSGGTGNINGESIRTVFTFEKVPEPSSTLLLGLSGLALATRRRRM